MERTYLPELYRVRAVARGKLSDHENATRDAETALAIALEQNARPLISRAEATLHALLGERQGDIAERVGERLWPGGAKHG
jgi:hypothetical protein